jgi:hypothetical protein
VTCRVLQDPAQAGWYEAAYEASRERSPFNQRLYARRNFPGEVRLYVGATRFSKTATGVETRELSREELPAALRNELGLSVRLVDEWVRSGCLDSSLEPSTRPKPPPPSGVRPSLRTRAV